MFKAANSDFLSKIRDCWGKILVGLPTNIGAPTIQTGSPRGFQKIVTKKREPAAPELHHELGEPSNDHDLGEPSHIAKTKTEVPGGWPASGLALAGGWLVVLARALA